ncbi:hypothetical protein EI94DRAFT_1787602 [Lactarius quietus]|nr:hypothetical protein EI94DRAFT_1787602 [Lactarius quietus]
MHHQVLLAMSSGKIPRLDRILRVASDHHMSVAAILDLIQKAGHGIYHPKGFDEDEDLQTLLFLRLGAQGRLHAVLMLDEIVQETRLQWCDRTNQILGWCREHMKGKCMDFNSIADAELLFGEMVSRNVHLAHEATIGVIGLLCNNSRFYSAKPFLISGSCKKESAEDHLTLIQTALDAIKGVDALQNTRVVSIASDTCTLLDLHVGDDDITCDKDWKHTGAKRPRNALLREKGLLVHGIWITPAVLRSHLVMIRSTCQQATQNCHDYPEAHTWESHAEEDIEEEEAVHTLVAAEDDSYLAYDEACKVHQLSPRCWQEGYDRTSKGHVTRGREREGSQWNLAEDSCVLKMTNDDKTAIVWCKTSGLMLDGSSGPWLDVGQHSLIDVIRSFLGSEAVRFAQLKVTRFGKALRLPSVKTRKAYRIQVGSTFGGNVTHLLEAGYKPQHPTRFFGTSGVFLGSHLVHRVASTPVNPLHLFGSMCHHFLMPYICVDLSIEDQLEYLSYAAHLALVLYAHDKACNDFIPTALYVDLILMVKNVFFCATKAKIDTPNDDFNIILLGTDRLENLFGCLCTIIGNDANVDNYQLGSHLTGTMESANILAMHPEWDKAPRCLHLLCMSRDSSEIPASADHISPHSWRASQALSSLTPPTLWIRGRRRLENDHPFSCDILHAVEAIPGATVLAPFGTLLIHASLPVDDIEDSSHDDVLHGLVQDAVSSDPLNAPITGNGMCDFEDAATSLDWALQQRTFSNVVAVDDNTATLNKSQALSLLFKYSKSTSSADQLRRVQQQARFVQSDPETLLDNSSDETGALLMVNNPIASLISCEENIFLCIGEIIGIHLGSKAVDYLRLDVLLEDTVHITYQVYSLVCTYPDNDNLDSNTNLPKNDWKTSSLLPLKLKVPGNLIQPINPSLAMPSSHTPYYLFDTPMLIALTSSLRDRLTNPQLKFIPRAAQTDCFPYRERSGQACFVAEDLYDVQESSMHKCPACTPPVQLNTSNGQRVLAHIASHILHDLTIDKRSGRNYQWAHKYGGIAPCPNATNFLYLAAMVSSDSSPCSNVPLQCPYCSDGSPAVWRYNMQLHFQHRHPGVDTAKHQDLWKITPEEATAMKQIWDNRHRQRRPRGKGKSKVPLKVSDAHSSQRLSSYIASSDRITRDDVQDSDINEERVGEQEGGSSEDDNVPNAVVEARRQELSSKVCDDGQLWTHGAEGSGEGTSAAMITLVDGNNAARSDCIDSGEGGLEALVGSVDLGIGAISVDLAVETKEDAPEHTANISVPTSPRTDNVMVLTTERPTETEDNSSFLRGAQVSSFGWKQKLNKVFEISKCFCGKSAAPSVHNKSGDVFCCRVTGCETKWISARLVKTPPPPPIDLKRKIQLLQFLQRATPAHKPTGAPWLPGIPRLDPTTDGWYWDDSIT